jgi:hypothetical protein
VVYANDRSEAHSAQYAAAGNRGWTQTTDEMIPRNESGHPIKHVFTRSIPTSQCMTCHMHPGTNMLATYQGLTWWDNETDGDRMYPSHERSLSAEERVAIERRNPEGSALRGLWSDPEFLSRTGTPEFNSTLTKTQFADFHGHSWLFRAVFKRDRAGRLIDAQGNPVADMSQTALAAAVKYLDLRPATDRPATPAARAAERAGQVVHLKDIHLERGMQCVDCHFKQDSHGDGNLYGEPRNAVEIACVDCHGTVAARASLVTSGPAAPDGGTDMLELRATPFGANRFSRSRGTGAITQRSMVTDGLTWEIPQIMDAVTPGGPRYNEKAALAKTIQRDGQT